MKKDQFLVEGLAGKKTLKGKIAVAGAKNAILPAMAASLLFEEGLEITNVPDIEDVERMSELLCDIGAGVSKKQNKHIYIDVKKAEKTTLDAHASKQLRASIILSGPMLARFGKVSFSHPGGCVIGPRPIDIFLESFEKMGGTVMEEGEKYSITTKSGKLVGADIFFKFVSVTATETIMMAATLAEGATILRNAAMEPEIKDIADFLNSCGADIKGAGTPTIEINGGSLLSSKNIAYKTMSDRIETGSFLVLAALSGDKIEITNCNPEHISILIEILKVSGVPIEVKKDSIIVTSGKIKNEKLKGMNIRTHEYPGFATDMQAPMTVYLTQVSGESLVFETIFEGRLNYSEDLVKMGADITMWDTHRIMIKGPTELKGRELEGPDLRAGLAYVIAAIVAKGSSVINNVYYIDRGYEHIEDRLSSLGVSIKRIKE